jgi:5-(carboxyamino)imidazole ribonucleotide synthase
MMINLLGKHLQKLDITALHTLPGVKIHLYGKKRVEPNRKMGHITVSADSPAAVKRVADAICRLIGESVLS